MRWKNLKKGLPMIFLELERLREGIKIVGGKGKYATFNKRKTWPDCRHAASEVGRRRRRQTGYVPEAEGGFAPDACFGCCKMCCPSATIFKLLFGEALHYLSKRFLMPLITSSSRVFDNLPIFSFRSLLLTVTT
jgi:hypothetical protein